MITLSPHYLPIMIMAASNRGRTTDSPTAMECDAALPDEGLIIDDSITVPLPVNNITVVSGK